MRVNGDLEKFTQVKKEVKKLPKPQREVAVKLVSKLEFMNAELIKLEEIIKEKGWVEEYQNGANQKGFKKCSEGEVYNTMVKNFTAGLKSLMDMLPEATEEDELEAWIRQ